MADYYRTHFTIDGGDSHGLELLNEVGGVVRDWAQEKYGESLGEELTGRWERNDTALHIERGRLPETETGYWRLNLEHPDVDADGFMWQVEIRLATTGDELEIDTIVQRTGNGDETPEQSVNAVRPRVLTTLAQRYDCKFGGERIALDARWVTQKDARDFVYEDVFDPNRRMPLVVVSENRLGGIFINPNRLQSRLLGLAKVATYDGKTSDAVNGELGEALGCWDGAIRVYRPGCSADDAAWRNRYWTWSRVNYLLSSSSWDETIGLVEDECVSSALPQAGSQMYHRVRDNVLRERYERVVGQLRRSQQDEIENADNKAMLDELTNTLAEYEKQRAERARQFERQISERDRQIDGLRIENQELQDQIDQLNRALSHLDSESAKPEEDDEQPPELESISDVVEYARDTFDTLRFFSRAVEMARKSEFPRPDELHEAFRLLNECADERISNTLAKDVKEWLKERGLDYAAGESPTTMGKYGNKRNFFDDEKKRHVEMQAHLRLGGGLGHHNQLRVHVCWDEDENKWLIGYIGRHLPTATG